MATMAIDWGKKRIGIAYMMDSHDVVFPLGSLENNANMLYSLAHLVVQHKIIHILIGYPESIPTVQKNIDIFLHELQFVIPDNCLITKVNEDYSSIQAGAQIGSFIKTPAEDSVAAMYLLEEWKKSNGNNIAS